MGLSVKVGSFNITTGAAGSTVAVTSVGFTPKAILFWWSGRTEAVDAAGRASVRRGVGMATATTFRALSTSDFDGIATSATAMGRRNDACILQTDEVSTVATNVGWADVQSMDVDGFTVEILDAFSINFRIHFFALGGTDLEAEIVTLTPAGSAGSNQTCNTTNVPKALFTIHPNVTTANTAASSSYSSISFAAATGSYQWTGGHADGSTSGTAMCAALMGELCGHRGAGTVASGTLMQNRATLVSFNTGTPGFTINWTERGAAHPIDVLVLSGTFQAHVGSTAASTSTGTITETGIAFEPTAIFFASHHAVAEASDAVSVEECLCLGATDGTTQLAHVHMIRNGNTTMFCQTGVSYDRIYQGIDVVAGTVYTEAAFTGFTSDGFTLDQTDNDTATSLIAYLAFASGAVGLVPRPRVISQAVHRAASW